MSSIHFHSEDTQYQVRKRQLLRYWLEQVASKEGYDVGALNLILCSDEYLHQLNIQYLEHDTFTDIITFNYNEAQYISGDLFISIDRVRENAKLLKESLSDELHRVMVHGVLHLCGYKDKSLKDSKLMREKEDFYLSLRPF